MTQPCCKRRKELLVSPCLSYGRLRITFIILVHATQRVYRNRIIPGSRVRARKLASQYLTCALSTSFHFMFTQNGVPTIFELSYTRSWGQRDATLNWSLWGIHCRGEWYKTEQTWTETPGAVMVPNGWKRPWGNLEAVWSHRWGRPHRYTAVGVGYEAGTKMPKRNATLHLLPVANTKPRSRKPSSCVKLVEFSSPL